MDVVSLFMLKNINGIIVIIVLFYFLYVHLNQSLTISFIMCYILYFFYLLTEKPSYIKPNVSSSAIPKVIYTYWHDSKKSPMVKKCIASWKRHNPSYEIRILNKESIREYNLPITEDMTPQFISDMVRLGVLSKHGGFWMDASVYLHDSLDWVHTHQVKEKCEFVGYEQPTGEGYPGIESWFFACIPQSTFVMDWKDEFFKSVTFPSIHLYISSLKQNKIQLSHLYNPEYLCIYASVQALVQKNHSYSLCLLNGNGPLSLMAICCYPFYPLFYKEPVVKYVSWTRKWMEQSGMVDWL